MTDTLNQTADGHGKAALLDCGGGGVGPGYGSSKREPITAIYETADFTPSNAEHSAVIDFTNPRWGHAMNPHTWRQESMQEADRDRKIFRYRVIVHSESHPMVGNVIQYRVEDGIRKAEVYGVTPVFNPPDMFLLLVFIRHQDRQCGILKETRT